jgi:hypothetical protein
MLEVGWRQPQVPSPRQMSLTRPTPKYELRVNWYDRVSSLLVALLVICSSTVGGLVIVYFARRLYETQVAIPIQPVTAASRPAEAALGLKRDIEPPGIEEVPELIEPQLQDTLSALSTAVTTKSALLADDDIDAELDPGHGSGLGDNRQAGAGGGAGPQEPRREIRFEPESLDHYAQWLDFFGIELGVLGSDNKVYYAYNLSQAKPAVRVGEPAQEQRLYMNPTDSQFAAFDRQLAAKAGIAEKGQIILQFYPPPTQAILYQLEQQRAAGRKPEQIRHTVFRVKPSGKGFEFSVEEQSYR